MSKIRVLLVDDEDDVRVDLADYLALEADFMVDDFARGQDALAHLQSNRDQYTAVILDWVLTSDLTGEEVLQYILTDYPQLPVIVTTGQAPTGGLDAYRGGAYKYLQKPINRTELINTISSLARQDMIFREMARDIRTILGSDICLAWKLNRQTHQLRLVAWDGGDLGDEVFAQEIRLDPQGTVINHCMVARKPFLIPQINLAPQYPNSNFLQKADAEKWESLYCIPLFFQKDLIGLLHSFTKKEVQFSDSEEQEQTERILEAFANQAVAAARNANLSERMNALNDINKLLAGAYEEKEIIKRILSRGLELVGSSAGWIHRVDIATNKLILEAWYGTKEELIYKTRVSAEEDITAYVAQKGEARNLSDIYLDINDGIDNRLKIRSQVAVPLRREEQTIGVLTAIAPYRWAFSSDDEDLLMALGTQAAIVIEREKLTNHIQKVSELALRGDEKELLEYVVNAVRDLTGAEASFWMPSIRDGEGDRFLRIGARTSGIPGYYANEANLSTVGEESLHAQAWRKQAPIVVQDILEKNEAHFHYARGVSEFGCRSFLVVPLVGEGNEKLGTLSLYGKIVGQFGQPESGLMQSFANQVAVALQQQKQNIALQKLAGISQSVTERIANQPRELFNELAHLAQVLTGADCIIIYPFDPVKKRFFDHENITAVGLLDRARQLRIKHKPYSGRFAAIIRQMGALIVNDIQPDSVNFGQFDVQTSGRDFEHRVKTLVMNSDFINDEKIEAFVGIALNAREQKGEVEGDLVGILYVNFRGAHHFSQSELQIIDIFAHQAANVIWGAHLYRAEQRQAAELEAIRQTTLTILSEVDLEPLLQTLVTGATKLLNGSGGKVYTRVPGKEQIQLVAAENVDHAKEPLGYIINYGQGLAGQIMLTKKPQFVNNYGTWDGRVEEIEDLFGAIIEVPLLSGDEPIGVLGVFDNDENRKFSADDYPILQRLAQQAALAINSATLVQKERELREQAETLREVSNVISSKLNLAEVTNRILDELRKVIHFENSTIQLIKGDERELITYRGYGKEETDIWLLRSLSDDPLVNRIIANRQPLIISNIDQEAPQDWEIRPDTENVKSWVGLPLIYGQESIGFVTLDHTEPGYYTDNDLALLSLFADQAAIAIQNAQLFEEVERRQDAQITAVGDIARSIANTNSIDTVLDGMLDSVVTLIDGTSLVEILLLDKKTNELVLHRYRGAFVSKELHRRPISKGIVGWVARNMEILVIPDIQKDDRYLEPVKDTRSEIGVPLLSQGNLIGVLNIEHPLVGAFTTKDQQLAEAIAGLAVIAFENTSENIKQLKELINLGRLVDTIFQATKQISGASRKTEILQTIVDIVITALPASHCILFILEEDGSLHTRTFAGLQSGEFLVRRYQIGEGLPGWVAQEGETRIVDDTSQDPLFQPGSFDKSDSPRSMLLTPLWVEGNVIGVISVANESTKAFNHRDQRFLETLSIQAGIAIQQDNHRLRRAEAIRSRFNPYVVGPPILDPNAFFGRKEIIQRIMDGIHRNSYIIFGERRIGKTSLLWQIDHHLKQASLDDDLYFFLPVLLDMSRINGSQFFWSLMVQLARRSQISQRESWIEPPKEDYNDDLFEFDLETILDHLQAENLRRDVQIVFLLDEMDSFINYDSSIHEAFRSLFQTEIGANLRVILSGVAVHRLRLPTSPWYNFMQEIQLDVFDEDAARRSIVEPVRGRYAYSNRAIDALLQYSKLKPQEIQRLAHFAVIEMLNRIHAITREQDEEVYLENAIISLNDVMNAIKTASNDNN